MTVYTTASDKHACFLQSLGATKVFPRTTTADEIQKAVGRPIKYAFVCVPNEETEALAVDVLEKKEGSTVFCTRPPWPTEKKDGMVTVKSGLGSTYVYPVTGRKFWANIEGYLAEGVRFYVPISEDMS
jgi:NADPH:quinone reductase-like Zn-dependent oxidoreductase